MNAHSYLPPNVCRIDANEPFTFDCRPDSSCFTECCRKLELALSPYDVLRLCRATELSSDKFLDRYVIIEQGREDVFPRFYLSMVDDGKESCVFVSPEGCTVYDHRPGACRTYPLGRAVIRQNDGLSEFYVLLRENHCLGFSNNTSHTAVSYSKDQKLEPYNRFNDALAAIIQHEKVRAGITFNREQIDSFILALYNLDQFRTQLATGKLDHTHTDELTNLAEWDHETLLLYGIDWLKRILFEQFPGNTD